MGLAVVLQVMGRRVSGPLGLDAQSQDPHVNIQHMQMYANPPAQAQALSRLLHNINTMQEGWTACGTWQEGSLHMLRTKSPNVLEDAHEDDEGWDAESHHISAFFSNE